MTERADRGEHRRHWICHLSTACAALVVVVIVASAYLRLADAGLGCAHWPRCYAVVESAPNAVKAAGITPVRVLQRSAASSALLVVIALVWLTWRRRPRLVREGRHALLLLVLCLVLTVIGWFAGRSTLPAIVLANLFGGFLMLAVAWRLRGLAAPGVRLVLSGRSALRGWACFGALLLVAEIFFGTLISADFAARSCTDLPLCGGMWRPNGAWAYVFNLLHDFAGNPLPMRDGGAIVLHMAHRVLALATAAVLGVTALRAIALPPALAILVLLFVELVLGAAAIGYGLPLTLVMLHNICAALLLAATVALLRGLPAAPRIVAAPGPQPAQE